MKRFALAALLALIIGSQADAQILRRSAYYYPSSGVGYSYMPSYVTPSYYTSSSYYTPAVTTAGYYTAPSTWSYAAPAATWSYPTTAYSYPSYSYPYTSSYYSYPTYTSGSYYVPRGIAGRRGYWMW